MKSLGNGRMDGLLLLILLLPVCVCVCVCVCVAAWILLCRAELPFSSRSRMFIIRSTRNKGLRGVPACVPPGPRVAKEDDSSCDPLFSHEAQHPIERSLGAALHRACPGAARIEVVRGSVRRPMCNAKNWNREAIEGLWCALK